MSSAICFNSDQSKILLSGNWLQKQDLLSHPVALCLTSLLAENEVDEY